MELVEAAQKFCDAWFSNENQLTDHISNLKIALEAPTNNDRFMRMKSCDHIKNEEPFAMWRDSPDNSCYIHYCIKCEYFIWLCGDCFDLESAYKCEICGQDLKTRC